MITPDCLNRLINFKFRDAADELTGDSTKRERDLVKALAETFGNPGWFVGGAMEVIIFAAIQSIVEDEVIRAEHGVSNE